MQDITDLTRLAASPELPGSAAASASGHGDEAPAGESAAPHAARTIRHAAPGSAGSAASAGASPAGAAISGGSAAAQGAPLIDDMTFIRQLGRGGFGEAWLAEDSGRRRCVVKVLNNRASEIELAAYKEYKNLCDASADGLVPIGTMLRTRDGRYWYTMEPADDLNPQNQDPNRYEGCTLEALIRRESRLPAAEVLVLAETCLAAIERLHRKGLAHCDIKPGNLLRIGGKWRLGDTGTLLHASDLPSRACSPAYAPPEGIVELRDDLYCLGKTLYQALTGRVDTYPAPTFFEQTADDAELNLLRGLNQVILHACSTDPRGRYGSAEQMMRDVRAVRGGAGSRGGRRWRVLTAAVAAPVALAALVMLLILPAIAAAPLEAKLRVTYWGEPDPGGRSTPRGEIGIRVPAVPERHDVRAEVQFTKAAYCHLLALTAAGDIVPCVPADPAAAPTRAKEFVYPTAPSGFKLWSLKEGPGLHAFALIASRRPLAPWSELRRELGDLEWTPVETTSGWEYRDGSFLPLAGHRGPEERHIGITTLEAICTRLRSAPGVERIHVIAFPVVPAVNDEDEPG
jgi:hypothetical protein